MEEEDDYSPPAKKQKQLTLPGLLERGFSKQEQSRAEVREVLCAIMNGWSHNGLETPWFTQWVKVLRPDYKPPCRTTIHRIVKLLHEKVNTEVKARLAQSGVCSIAWDSWENHHKIPMIGFCAVLPNQDTLLVRLEEVHERQTSDYLAGRLRDVVQELATYGCRVIGSIQDNGANVKKAANLVFPMVAFSAHLVLTSRCALKPNCGAHTGNLLLEDFGDVYRRQFDQCSQLQQFFSNRHRACCLYAEFRKVRLHASASLSNLFFVSSGTKVCQVP
jgi:hypothetical protein